VLVGHRQVSASAKTGGKGEGGMDLGHCKKFTCGFAVCTVVVSP
jgi:hypothetical protein